MSKTQDPFEVKNFNLKVWNQKKLNKLLAEGREVVSVTAGANYTLRRPTTK
jgi:hypothetical protein